MPDPAAVALASLLDWLLKGFLILAVTFSLDLLLRASSASLRHLVWMVGLAAAVLLPVMSAMLPRVSAPLFSLGFLTPHPSGDSASTAASPGSSPAFGAVQILLWIYLAGAVLVLAWQLVGRVYAARVKRQAERIADGELIGEMRRLRLTLGIRRDVELLSSSLAPIPFSAGFVRPAIVLPAAWASWPQSVCESVMVHELGHIRRRDCLARMTAQLGCCIHWMNPLAWYGLGRMMMEQEIACDTLVLETGTKPSVYARNLLALAGIRGERLHFAMTALGRRAELQKRLLEILKPGRSRAPLRIRSSAAFLAAAFGLLLPISVLNVWRSPDAGPVKEPYRLMSPTADGQPEVPGTVAGKAEPLGQPELTKEYIAGQIAKMKAEGTPEAKIEAYVQKAKAKLVDIERKKKQAALTRRPPGKD